MCKAGLRAPPFVGTAQARTSLLGRVHRHNPAWSHEEGRSLSARQTLVVGQTNCGGSPKSRRAEPDGLFSGDAPPRLEPKARLVRRTSPGSIADGALVF